MKEQLLGLAIAASLAMPALAQSDSFDVAGSPSLPAATRERMLSRLEGRLVDGVVTVTASEQRAQLANRRAARPGGCWRSSG